MSLDMTLLPAPAVIEALDFEHLFQQRLAQLKELLPDHTLELESDPAIKLLEVMAFQELLMRQRINDAARACMLAYARKSDLDQLAANFGVQRLVVTPANPTAVPPTAAVLEDDERLRERAQSALEGMTTAGSKASYRFHAMSADARVADVGVDSPQSNGTVRVTVLPTDSSGVAPADLLTVVRQALNAETVRPLTDLVQVQAAQLVYVPIRASLYRLPGPAGEGGAAAARAALDTWLTSTRRLGAGLPRSGLFAALHQPGIARVVITSPTVDVSCTAMQCVLITSINLTEFIVDAQ